MRSRMIYCLLAAIIICGIPGLVQARSTETGPKANCITATAQRHIDARHFDAAAKVVRHALTAAPSNPDLRMQMGVIQRSTGQYAEARKQFRFAMTNRDKDRHWVAKCYAEIGKCWELDGDSREAILQYQLALATVPDFHDAEVGIKRTVAMSQRTPNK